MTGDPVVMGERNSGADRTLTTWDRLLAQARVDLGAPEPLPVAPLAATRTRAWEVTNVQDYVTISWPFLDAFAMMAEQLRASTAAATAATNELRDAIAEAYGITVQELG